MHIVPPNLHDIGVLVEPLTIAEKALIQVWDVQDRLPWTAPGAPAGDGHGQKALVLGGGPVGLLGALALLTRGFETFIYSREAGSGPVAQWISGVGAHYVSSQAASVEELARKIGNIDLVY